MKQNETKRMMGKKKSINVIRRSLRKIAFFIDQLTFKKVIMKIISFISLCIIGICLLLLFFTIYEQTCNSSFIKDNIQFIIILILLVTNCCFVLHFTTKE